MGQVEGTSAAQLEERYFRQKVKLGQGSFGTVWRAIDRKSGETVAIKQLLKANFELRGVTRGDIMREMALMKACRHRNITELLGFFENSASLFLAVEYCDGGDFGDKIRELGTAITESEASGWVRQMCDAVCVLHTQGICHRDIKPDNFMVHNRTRLKLSDFGLATSLQKGQLLQDVCGTRAFNAPEQHPIAVKSGGYGFPVDIWAVGISMYMVMFGGRHPFVGDDGRIDEVRMLAGSMDFRDRTSAPGFLGLEGPGGMGLRFSEAARNFCRRLADREPGRRIEAWEAVYEPWLRTNDEFKSSSSSSSCSRALPSPRDKLTQLPPGIPRAGRAGAKSHVAAPPPAARRPSDGKPSTPTSASGKAQMLLLPTPNRCMLPLNRKELRL